jgi:ABC-type nitrate/sulfonate/bicarbonate transport system substrate-binding protein
MKRVLVMLLVLSLGLCMFAASAGAEGEKTKLRVAVQSYYCSSLMGLVQERGWADDYNLELEYSVFSSGATINEAMGEWDVAVTGGAFIYALANYDCKLIAHQIDGTAYNDIFVREGTEIAEASLAGDTAKVAELVKGKTILTNVGITGHYGLILWLESLGLTADDVNFVSQDMSTIYASWVAGEGDLGLLTFPYGTMVEDSVIVGSLGSAGGNMYEATVCTADAYNNKYDAVVDFVKLIYRACDELAADKELALKTVGNWYVDNGKDLDEQTVLGEVSSKPFISSAEAKGLDLTSFAVPYAKYLVKQGLVETDRVEVINANCANDILKAALSDEIFQ